MPLPRLPDVATRTGTHIAKSSEDDDHHSQQDESLDRDALHTTPIVVPDRNAQMGVQDIEATTIVWTKKYIVIAYILIWLIYFVDSIQASVSGALAPFVTSAFQEHHLTATTQVMSQLIGGLSKITLAKILDVWGRPQGYLMSVVLLTIGLVMMAVCRNVETYAAAQVFYAVGYNNIGYALSVFIADTSDLRSRSLMYAFATSPFIITSWIGGPIAQSLLSGPGFRWGFGILAVVTPLATLPLFFVFWHNLRKARALGLVAPRNSGRTASQSIWHYAIQFDAAGLLLFTAGMTVLLLPFNVAPAHPDNWAAAQIICMIVFGAVLIVAFVLHERFLAPVTWLPYRLLTDRTIVGACVLAAALFVSFYVWTSFFSSFLQVVFDLSVAQASYVGNIYSVGSCLFSFAAGMFIRHTGRFKPVALYFGVPLTILGVGLMLVFRRPGMSLGYIIMCEVMVAFAGGTLVICEQLAVMAAVTHQHVATVLALESMFASVGGAVGSTVSSAIWGSLFPVKLYEYLPAESKPNFSAIYGQLTEQKAYPVGSPTRTAINNAYGEAQKYMLIAATAVHLLSVLSVAVWRNINVRKTTQVRGVVI